ncbi:MAG: alternative ribosome rescue aminoacyl-tRNA hydrolase ArfB [Desulfobacterales bacterium]|jgi:ribosome-associated protein|nr:alternative ribosome rescue aminoacyl-tRNA hydrolase ArfB [Desulfobacterales bacterium]
MLQVTDAIQLDEREIEFKFIRSPGPGGQHVNKAATAVQLRFDLAHSTSLPDHVRSRLTKLAKNRINTKGVLIISANRFRSQDLNRKDALDRLLHLIVKSTWETKPRRRTKPTLGSVKKRIESKKRRSKVKHARQSVIRVGD